MIDQNLRDPMRNSLDAFEQQFKAQISNAGAPSSEHAIHFCLALGFQAALDLAPGSVVFEKPAGKGRIDLWIRGLDLLIEVKYRRAIPSGRNLPATAIFGSLLADFSKVAAAPAKQRAVVLVSDQAGMGYITRSGHGLLPMTPDQVTTIDVPAIERLPRTAATKAVEDGAWIPLSASLFWNSEVDPWSLACWLVEPIS